MSALKNLDYSHEDMHSLHVIHRKNIQTEKELTTILTTPESSQRVDSLVNTICIDLDVVLKSSKKSLDQYSYQELEYLHNILRSRLTKPVYSPSRHYVETILGYTRQINRLLDSKLAD